MMFRSSDGAGRVTRYITRRTFFPRCRSPFPRSCYLVYGLETLSLMPQRTDSCPGVVVLAAPPPLSFLVPSGVIVDVM